MKLLITGGAGFIGSALIRYLIHHTEHSVINIDKLTYAGNLANLASVSGSQRYLFYQTDITEQTVLSKILNKHQPDAIIHLAAESHVDRSIDTAEHFIHSNIIGTYALLETTHHYWQTLPEKQQQNFRFLHVSTDEVYGDLGKSEDCFHENSPYAPNSPYSASKAASDHLVRAWHKTHQLPTIITHSSNNYGHFQYPEKLIPKTIISALNGKPIEIYGTGEQIRDWLYVDEHIRALYCVLQNGRIGENYLIGGQNPQTNIAIVQQICTYLEELAPNKPAHIQHYRDLITHITDRKGHDMRYALDSSKIQQLGWCVQTTFTESLKNTVQWYITNKIWWQNIQAA
ncbi:MAG: dTDP-glucose 4,6-dehydratase [Neisseriaceae bacterium]|nr:dTDP-glucose 4,6-dehydratase [Neisseriaceae bacterium]